MKIKLTESQLKRLLNEEDKKKDPISMLKKVGEDIKKLLSYYRFEDTDEGRIYKDKETDAKAKVGPVGSFYKDKIESILFGAEQENKDTQPLIAVKNQIINDKDTPNFTEYFGDYDNVNLPTDLKFDYYTGKKCREYNRTGCGK